MQIATKDTMMNAQKFIRGPLLAKGLQFSWGVDYIKIIYICPYTPLWPVAYQEKVYKIGGAQIHLEELEEFWQREREKDFPEYIRNNTC